MACEYLVNTIKQPCNYYIKTGYCSRPDRFKCEEYMSRFEFEISYSSMKLFERCPQAYYLSQIVGVESLTQSDPLKIGKYVDNVLAGKPEMDSIEEIEEGEEEKHIWLYKAMAIVEGIKHYELNTLLLQYEKQKEFTINQDGIPHLHGFLDFAGDDHFCELKVTGKPEIYKDRFMIEDQVATYFLSNQNYKYCIMFVVKSPELKPEKKEDIYRYYERCRKDVVGRPYFYFGENFNAREKIFGMRFYRNDFNLDNLIKKYQFVCDEIKMCIDRNYWMQRKSACLFPFLCGYKTICELDGKIPEKLYKHKIKKEGTNENNKTIN